jgi:hypothetical protein
VQKACELHTLRLFPAREDVVHAHEMTLERATFVANQIGATSYQLASDLSRSTGRCH